jgi:hypothetical protein
MLVFDARSIRCVVRVFFAALLVLCCGSSHAAASTADRVSLTESTIAWSTVKYSTTSDNGLVDGSLDTHTIVERRFKTYVIENRFLKVTLLPEFGGRIISIIYKPTGHEELYRNEVGVPYGMNGGVFYYDWMMVYGGIFPTFPDPEHGKTWLKPWDFKVVTQSDREVTVAMSLKDDFDYSAAPKQFRRGSTGLAMTYTVTLKADRAAVDALMMLTNPSSQPVDYEYWTCTTLAPGSDPEHPRATAGAEIIGPIAAYSTPRWSNNLARGDNSLGPGRSRFDRLRYFRNWPTMGIAYAAPDMQGGNFWGAINHDNGEGIIRVADNAMTPGLKMWTWGFPSLANAGDARSRPDPAQPYVELWAGASDQFYHSAHLAASGKLLVPETYSPSVGMSDVTQANEQVLINFSAKNSVANLEFVSLEPDVPLRVVLKRGEAVVFDAVVQPDPRAGNRFLVASPDSAVGEPFQLTIGPVDGSELISAQTTMR